MYTYHKSPLKIYDRIHQNKLEIQLLTYNESTVSFDIVLLNDNEVYSYPKESIIVFKTTSTDEGVRKTNNSVNYKS